MIKLLRITTIPLSLNVLLKGQLKFLSQHFDLVGVCAPGEEVSTIQSREGIRVETVPMEREIAPIKDLASLRKLIGLFKKEKPQIVHTNTPKSSLLSMIAARITGVPIRIYYVTGLRFEGFPNSAKRSLLVNMERITCKFATHVIPEGEGVKKALIANNITNKPLDVVAKGNINGIDTAYFSKEQYTKAENEQLRCSLGIASSDFVFCFIGRLVTDKGIQELTAAFVKLQSVQSNKKLLLVGPYEDAGNALPPSIKNIIEQHKAIITTGFANDVRPYLAISDVFVFPSYREGFPNVVMQAGAMDLPCIVTNINGSNEIIEEGKNGIIVAVKNKEELALAMAKMYEDKAYRLQLQKNCRPMITSRYEQKVVWEAMLQRYNEYLREKNIAQA